MALSWNEIKDRALKFSKEWADTSNEEADAKPFLVEFFNVFGISSKRVSTFEHRVPISKFSPTGGGREGVGYIDLLWKGTILIEMKSRGKNLDKAYAQAIEYTHGLKEHELPKYILVSDFENFRLYDLEPTSNPSDGGEFVEFKLNDFVNNVQHFGYILGYQKKVYKEQDPANIKAAELMGKLHDRLEEIGYTGHPLEVYLVRILFCLFAEDTTIFNKLQFQDYVEFRTNEDGSDLAAKLQELFQVLNTPKENRFKNLDEQLGEFPYINGKLFEENLPTASFDSKMRQALLNCCYIDWSKISPAIFGSMFQSVMNPKERRNLGAHYTSETNILKLIKPLFLDDLWKEFESIKDTSTSSAQARKLQEFHKKLSTLKFLDPACGCGNFLVITYRELRLLELEILRVLNKSGQRVIDISSIIWLDVDRFYGIEYEEFPARIAEVAMWLIDHQMNMLISNEFGQYFVRLPLKKSAKIVHGDALEIEWNTLLNTPNPTSLRRQKAADFHHITPEFLQANNIPTKTLIFSNQFLPYNPNLKENSKSLRKVGNLSEVLLWKELRADNFLGYSFYRQKPILNYIADFYCKELHLVIEIDGISHHSDEAVKYDNERNRQMKVLGLTVLRISDADVKRDMANVLRVIEYTIQELTPPNPLKEGELRFDYIIGNPPFIGSKMMTQSQRNAVVKEFDNIQGAGVLDYVTAWYIKAAKYLNSPSLRGLGGVKVAFVSTNSIVQGEQTSILWGQMLNKYNIKIHFAHRTFKWSNEAKGNAAVYCVIIGFANYDTNNKSIFEYEDIKGEAHEIKVKNINPYLVDARDLLISKRTNPLCNVPKILKGNQPTEGGNLIMLENEKYELISKYPILENYIKALVGAEEFLYNKPRYCFWFPEFFPPELRNIRELTDRLKLVQEMRKASTDPKTRELANQPYRFREMSSYNSFVIVPSTTSENRKYIPMGFGDKNIIPTNLLLIIPNGNFYHFGVLTSTMHMAWVKSVCGRLESRYRYSASIVYNNYPWPENPTDKQVKAIEEKAQAVLNARASFQFPSAGGVSKGRGGSSLADLYDPLTMPPALVKAHNELDKAVDLAYRPQPFTNEANRMEFLFELYEKYTADLFTKDSPKKIKKTV